jgi:hypothetical protein
MEGFKGFSWLFISLSVRHEEMRLAGEELYGSFRSLKVAERGAELKVSHLTSFSKWTNN